MILAHEIAPPPFISSIYALENSSGASSENTNSTVAADHYEPKENRDDQMERHEKVSASDSQHASVAWRREVHLSDNYSRYRQEFAQILEPFFIMSDGCIGRISVAKHRIELTPGGTPIHSAPE